MLKRFRVSNFRSLLNIEFLPVGLNLLIGPNNAGKTNLCSALRFLGMSSLFPIEKSASNALGETWNITNVYVNERSMEFEVEASLCDDGDSLGFNYQLKVDSHRDSASLRQALTVAEESLRLTGGGFKDTVLVENQNGRVRLLHEKWFLERTAGDPYVETFTPLDATMLSRLYDLETNRRANLFKRWLQTWNYYSLSPMALRSTDVITDAPVLRHDGANLSKVLHTLHNENPRVERKLIEELRNLEPKLDLFTFQSPDPTVVHMFLEDANGNRFSTKSVSDGTVRFLAMAYLIQACAEAKDRPSPVPLLMIEEPENGLYVRVLKPLLERIDPSGSSGQFVFTTHSPYFVDLFDGNLTGVHLLKPGKPSSVLARPDAEKVRQLLNEMPLGELHFREMLG